MRSLGWVLIQYDGKRRLDTYRRKFAWRRREKMAVCKPSREASEETVSADTLIMDM